MKKTLILTALAVTALLIAGCAAATNSLDDNRQKWQQQDIDDYDFTIQVLCFCLDDVTRPVRIEVRGGIVQSMVYADDSTAVTNDYFDDINTIEKLFQVIDDAIEDDADELIIDYDLGFGFPKKIDIDFLLNAVDDEITYTISGFTSYN